LQEHKNPLSSEHEPTRMSTGEVICSDLHSVEHAARCWIYCNRPSIQIGSC